MVNGHVDHVYMDVGVGIASVMICAGFAVVFGFIQILFFDDLLALDHTASAIRAFIFSLNSSGAAAGAGLVILDLGADDLLLGGIRGGAESQTREDPLEELEDQEAGDSDHEEEHDEPEYDHRPIVSLFDIVVTPASI